MSMMLTHSPRSLNFSKMVKTYNRNGHTTQNKPSFLQSPFPNHVLFQPILRYGKFYETKPGTVIFCSFR